MKLTLPTLRFAPALAAAAWLLAGCASPQPSPTPPTAPLSAPPAETSSAAAIKSEAAVHPKAIEWSAEWMPLWTNNDLSNWTVTDFVASGPVKLQNGKLSLGAGAIMTGVNWTNGPLPKTNYEISLETLRSDGSDFFCGLTFPVGDTFCSLILGGWGGAVVGLSSLDDLDASENETSQHCFFEDGRWYHVTVRVTADKIVAWLDEKKIISALIKDRKVSLRPGPIEFCRPLGLATYQTGARARNIKLRLITP